MRVFTCPNCGIIYSDERYAHWKGTPSEHYDVLEYDFKCHLLYTHGWTEEDAKRYIEWVKNE